MGYNNREWSYSKETPETLKAWMDRHNFCRKQAAGVLGLSYFSVRDYLRGINRIPYSVSVIMHHYDLLDAFDKLMEENKQLKSKLPP